MAAKMAHISDERHGPGTAGVWIAFTRLLTLAVFAQAIFAGLLLSGEVWGRAAHRATALGLVAAALLGGIVALVTLRHVAGGRRLAVALLGLALVLAAQMTVGLLAAGGERLLWLHVPLGVALVGFTLETAGVARQLSPGGAVSRPSTTDSLAAARVRTTHNAVLKVNPPFGARHDHRPGDPGTHRDRAGCRRPEGGHRRAPYPGD